MSFHFAAAAVALLAERIIGYPKPLYQTIGHPVEWIGKLLAKLEFVLYDSEAEPIQARLRGAATLISLVIAAAIPAMLVSSFLSHFNYGWIIEALLATTLIAQHSLHEHVSAVGKGLDISLSEGRKAVSMIAGRDPALDRSGRRNRQLLLFRSLHRRGLCCSLLRQ